MTLDAPDARRRFWWWLAGSLLVVASCSGAGVILSIASTLTRFEAIALAPRIAAMTIALDLAPSATALAVALALVAAAHGIEIPEVNRRVVIRCFMASMAALPVAVGLSLLASAMIARPYGVSWRTFWEAVAGVLELGDALRALVATLIGVAIVVGLARLALPRLTSIGLPAKIALTLAALALLRFAFGALA